VPREHTTERMVQFAETDLAGILHFANFFRIMEEVEHHWFRSMGLSVAMNLEKEELGFPRVATSCEYSSPARFEEILVCRLRVTAIGTKSLSHEVEFRSGGMAVPGRDDARYEKGRKIATGKTTMVCTVREKNGLRSIPIPEVIRHKIES